MRSLLLFSCFYFLMISYCQAQEDSVNVKTKTPFLKKVGVVVNDFIEAFNDYDTTYIEPNHYNFTAMVQGTQSMEKYLLKTKDNKMITLGPDLNPRVGPYFGWRWLFLGYQLDVNMGKMANGDKMRKDFGVSLYTALFGVDFFYRETGNYYKIKSIELGPFIDTSPLKNVSFSGINVGVFGFNIYYVFNHKKFSYPAAYSQSTQQKRSAGSFIGGIGYTRHSLDYDHTKLDDLLIENHINPAVLDSFRVKSVKYTDVNFSLGYSYNWVFAKNCLFNASASLALAIDRSEGEYDSEGVKRDWFKKVFFSINDFNVDGVGRFGVVYNNGKWFAGTSAILHTYSYRSQYFSTRNFFGDINLYVGFNFSRRKK